MALLPSIHSLCDNGKQCTHSAATGELINPEPFLSPLAVMTSTQKPSKTGWCNILVWWQWSWTLCTYIFLSHTHTKIAAAFKNPIFCFIVNAEYCMSLSCMLMLKNVTSWNITQNLPAFENIPPPALGCKVLAIHSTPPYLASCPSFYTFHAMYYNSISVI